MPGIPTHLRLSPQPFRQWCAWRVDPAGWNRPGPAPVDDSKVVELCFDLGISERQLFRWRNENVWLDRLDMEDALHHAGFSLWDVYPGSEGENGAEAGNRYCAGCKELVPAGEERECLWCGRRTQRKNYTVDARLHSKLTDSQLQRLYELHRQGVTVRELGRRVYRVTGYKSWETAEKGIGHGFRRLGLPTIKGSDQSLRRCQGTKTWWPAKGSRCKKPPMVGADFCREHDPERREEVLRTVSNAGEIQRDRSRLLA